jgi:diguanylate cyclase (GGDEF)-like protein
MRSIGGVRGAVLRSALTRFAIVSLIPTLALGLILSAQVNRAMEQRTAKVYAEMTDGIFHMAEDLVVQPGDLTADTPVPSPRAVTLKALIERLGATQDTIRVRVTRPDGSVAFGNHDEDAGTKVELDGPFRGALRGVVSSRVIHGSLTPSSDGSHTLIEVYLPVRFGDDPTVRGVVVASGIGGTIVAQIAVDVHRMQLILALGLTVLWLCSLRIVMSVSRRLRQTASANEYLALHDTLTGLPNRNLFNDRLSQAIAATARTGQLVGVLLIDLDGFKDVNDTLGHGKGDELLCEVAARLSDTVRSCDTVARLGGDEFGVVVTDIDSEYGLVGVALRLSEVLTGTVSLEGVEIALDASMGGSIYPVHADDPEELVRHADIAMYAAKASREPFIVYRADIDSHSPSRLALAAELRRALDAEDQLVVYYQPVASAETGRIDSVEALVRWRHPTRGLVPPVEFIPMAEQSGLIHPLSAKVLDLAIGQARQWVDDGLDISVAVNLSATDLRTMSTLEVVRSTLARHGLPPDRLELEVTETAILANPEGAVALVTALQELGVRIALDDFGTGFSSLTYLKRLKPDRLKIDRSFVDAMILEPTDAEIVRSVIDLAHSLHIGVTAEGVETQQHWDLLRTLACDLIQGFHLARPLDADTATRWLHQHTPAPAATTP